MQEYWLKHGWESDDVHLRKLKEMPFQRDFALMPTQAGLYIIRGPRQIGKSSWMKSILSLHARLDPAKCFYISCENLRDHVELAEVLASVANRRVILLDEVTFVSGWDRAVKHFIDSHREKIVVISGSNATDLRRGSDRMPGRFGHGGEYEMLPMDLLEFTAMRKIMGASKTSRVDEIEDFFRIGGFPIALSESGVEAKKPKKAIETYKKWLIGDFLKLGKQEVYLQEIIGQLALTMSSQLSLQGLSKKTQVGSHHTVQEYVATLEDCFALQVIYAIDPNTGALRFKKDKKFYFRDPIIYWLALDWLGVKAPKNFCEVLAEMVAAEFLKRRHTRFGYFESRKGEIDFYKKDQWAIEVKWSSHVQNLSNAYLDIVIPDKKVWFQENFLQE